MRLDASLVAVGLAVAAGASGCSCNQRSGGGAGAGAGLDAASSAPTASAMARPHGSEVPRKPEPPAACRALGVSGSVLAEDGAPIATAAELPGGWLTLGDGAEFTAKDPRTTRETTFRGKGSVRVCVGAEQESWLSAGAFESAPGAGESPGNEEWVMTPFGAVRYIAAGVKLLVGTNPTGLDVAVGRGTAYVLAAADANPRWASVADGGAPKPAKPVTADVQGWIPVDGAHTLVLSGPAPGKTGLSALVADCHALATAARALSDAVLNPAHRGDASFADVAQEQVIARRRARGACGVARVRARAFPPSDRDGALLRDLDESDTTWRGLGD